MRDRIPHLLALLGLLLATALIAGCGDDEDSASADTDPQTILDRALGGGEPIESGVLDLQFDLESASDPGGTISASLAGPFESTGDGSLPELDFDVTAAIDAAGTDMDFEGGITLTPDAGYVSFAGEDYEIDSATYDLLQTSYEQSSELQEEQGEESSSLAQFGIDPSAWVTDLTNEGTEDLDGTEVVHVSGTADVPKLVDDLTTVAEQTGQAQQLDPAALEQLNSSVEQADIDVYAASDDSTLRQFDLAVELADPTGSGGGNTTVVPLDRDRRSRRGPGHRGARRRRADRVAAPAVPGRPRVAWGARRRRPDPRAERRFGLRYPLGGRRGPVPRLRRRGADLRGGRRLPRPARRLSTAPHVRVSSLTRR